MPLYRTYESDGVVVAVWEISETTKSLIAETGADLARDSERFASEQRCREWLAVRLLLRAMSGDTARVEYDVHGKPFLCGNKGYISISHTRGFAAVAYSRQYPVGLDMELSDRVVSGAVARRFMREEEERELPYERLNAARLVRWTASEALYKLVGDLGGNYRDNILLERFMPTDSGVLGLSLVGLQVGVSCDYAAPDAKDIVDAPLFVAKYVFDAPLLLTLCHHEHRDLSRARLVRTALP